MPPFPKLNGARSTSRILLSNAVVLLLCLCLEIVLLCVDGPTTSVWMVYVIATTVLFLVAVSGVILTLRHGEWQLAIQMYAWVGLVGLVAMTVADYVAGRTELPWILFLLHIGVLSLGVTVGWRTMAVYALASAAVLITAGCLFNRIDNAGLAVIALALVALPAVEIEEVKQELETLKAALKIVIEAKKAANGKRRDNP